MLGVSVAAVGWALQDIADTIALENNSEAMGEEEEEGVNRKRRGILGIVLIILGGLTSLAAVGAMSDWGGDSLYGWSS